MVHPRVKAIEALSGNRAILVQLDYYLEGETLQLTCIRQEEHPRRSVCWASGATLWRMSKAAD